jgi:hypothetical protein
MGGGQQGSNPALDQIQQQQQYAALGKTLTQSLQGMGAAAAQPTAMPQPFGQTPPMISPTGQISGLSAGYGATGPIFSQQGGMGGIDEQRLAQILRALGYAG